MHCPPPGPPPSHTCSFLRDLTSHRLHRAWHRTLGWVAWTGLPETVCFYFRVQWHSGGLCLNRWLTENSYTFRNFGIGRTKYLFSANFCFQSGEVDLREERYHLPSHVVINKVGHISLSWLVYVTLWLRSKASNVKSYSSCKLQKTNKKSKGSQLQVSELGWKSPTQWAHQSCLLVLNTAPSEISQSLSQVPNQSTPGSVLVN